MKINEINLAKVEVASNTQMRNRGSLGRILRVYAVVTAVAILPARYAMADEDGENQQILPFPTLVESTIPTNGDVNPYGVAFVPNGFPAGGLLNPGISWFPILITIRMFRVPAPPLLRWPRTAKPSSFSREPLLSA